MTEMDLLQALTNVRGKYILEAGEFLKPCRRNHLRRIVLLAAVLILLSMLSAMTVMAVDTEFRECVFRFFHVQTVNIIPETIPEAYFEPTPFAMGDGIEGYCVHAPRGSHARNGVFLVCTDETEMNQGNHYEAYYEENGELIKLEAHSFRKTVFLHGGKELVALEWAEHDGQVHILWCPPNASFRKPNFGGGAERSLFYLNEYPFLLNLNTGETTDFLTGTGAEKLVGIANCFLTEDGTGALLASNDWELYYANLETKEMNALNDLSGEQAESCTLIGDSLVCWRTENGRFRVWNVNLDTKERTEILEGKDARGYDGTPGVKFLSGFDTMIHWGNHYGGSPFALEADEQGGLWVISLLDGQREEIPDAVWPDGRVNVVPSPDGQKLLLTGSWDANGNIGYMAVLDWQKRSFTELLRENRQNVRESVTYWFDNQTVFIESGGTDDGTELYVYRIN